MLTAPSDILPQVEDLCSILPLFVTEVRLVRELRLAEEMEPDESREPTRDTGRFGGLNN